MSLHPMRNLLPPRTTGLALLLLLAQVSLYASDDRQFEVIQRLGELNGVALHCKALAETQRMKRALVANLPKRRQLGEWFDQHTQGSFMRFMQENQSCPSAAELQQQVGKAISELEEVYRHVQLD